LASFYSESRKDVVQNNDMQLSERPHHLREHLTLQIRFENYDTYRGSWIRA